ncbi:MAG: tail fiber domain-containing protein [Pirellulaceae bacterium]
MATQAKPRVSRMPYGVGRSRQRVGPVTLKGGWGVYTSGSDNASYDLILGGTSAVNDDGRIFSDPAYPNSDIWLHSNDAVVIVLDDDGTGTDADFEILNRFGTNIFNVDEDGTVRVLGTVAHSSDRNRKEGVVSIDPAAILRDVVGLPIHRWRYRGQAVSHVGPMAQDFYSTFSVGADDTHIAGVDADGVALAAIQGLYELLMQQQV